MRNREIETAEAKPETLNTWRKILQTFERAQQRDERFVIRDDVDIHAKQIITEAITSPAECVSFLFDLRVALLSGRKRL